MVTTDQRRRVVTYLLATYAVSARRACRVMHLARSRWQHHSRRPDRTALRQRLKALAEERTRWGYPRLLVALRREGWTCNRKLVYRLYVEERLALRPRRRGRKHVARARVPRPVPTQADERWSMDFVHDALADGRRFRCFTLVDDHTREALAIEVDTALSGARVCRVLARVAAERGTLPPAIVCDNGSEFTGRVLDAWAHQHQLKLDYIRPGKPVENAYIESFNGRLREECLSAHWFTSLREAQLVIEAWREDYNTVRPHSSLGGTPPSAYAARVKGAASPQPGAPS